VHGRGKEARSAWRAYILDRYFVCLVNYTLRNCCEVLRLYVSVSRLTTGSAHYSVPSRQQEKQPCFSKMICDRSVNYVSKGKGVPRKDNDNTFITHTTLSFISSTLSLQWRQNTIHFPSSTLSVLRKPFEGKPY
jgi:hypothetical protein